MINIDTLLNTKRFKQALEAAEREITIKAYEYSGRNQSVTAKLLGVSRGTLIRRLKEYRVARPSDYRNQVESDETFL